MGIDCIRDTLVKKRKERGLSQKVLAEKLSISPSTLCKWEKGNIEVPINFYSKIAESLEISEEELLGFPKGRQRGRTIGIVIGFAVGILVGIFVHLLFFI